MYPQRIENHSYKEYPGSPFFSCSRLVDTPRRRKVFSRRFYEKFVRLLERLVGRVFCTDLYVKCTWFEATSSLCEKQHGVRRKHRTKSNSDLSKPPCLPFCFVLFFFLFALGSDGLFSFCAKLRITITRDLSILVYTQRERERETCVSYSCSRYNHKLQLRSN